MRLLWTVKVKFFSSRLGDPNFNNINNLHMPEMKEMCSSKITSLEEHIRQLKSALLAEKEANKMTAKRDEERIFLEKMSTPVRHQWSRNLEQQREEQVHANNLIMET